MPGLVEGAQVDDRRAARCAPKADADGQRGTLFEGIAPQIHGHAIVQLCASAQAGLTWLLSQTRAADGCASTEGAGTRGDLSNTPPATRRQGVCPTPSVSWTSFFLD
jgi:hypothetical protein